MAGLGNYNPQALYGTPLRETYGQAQQAFAGNQAIQGKQQEQQQLAEMQQAWAQAQGDPEKFLQSDAARYLSLDQRAKVMEMGQAQAQQSAASELAGQMAPAPTYPTLTGGPTVENAGRVDEYAAAGQKHDLYQTMAGADRGQFVKGVIGREFPGSAGGAIGQTAQMIAEVTRIGLIPENERTAEDKAYYSYAEPIVRKRGTMRQGALQKDYDFMNSLLPAIAAGDENALNAFNAVVSKVYKTGRIEVMEEKPGGEQITSLVPAPGTVPTDKKPFITKTTEPTAAAEGLREDIMGATNYLNLLDTMEKNLGATQPAGSVVPAPVHGAVTKFGLWSGWYGSEEAREWKVAEDKARADVQALIKGIPSNFDAEVFAKTNPSMDVTREENILRIKVQKEVLRELVGGTIAFYLKTGKQVPEQAIAVAGRLGLDPNVGIPYTGQDPFARAQAITNEFLARSGGGAPQPPGGDATEADEYLKQFFGE